MLAHGCLAFVPFPDGGNPSFFGLFVILGLSETIAGQNGLPDIEPYTQ
jgi:hypothetical protein